MNNTFFITGASSDIGTALIERLPEDSIIIAHYHSNREKLISLQERSRNKMILVQADFSSSVSINTMLETIELKIGVPDKIVHLAAPKFENIRFKDLKPTNLEAEFSVCVSSIVQILSRFLPKLAKERRGKVACMLSSVTLGVPPMALCQYTTIKYALMGLMKALASEYATKHVCINSISPSMVETQFLSGINEKIVQLSAANHPLKRNARVADVIPILLMLLSDDTDYINGVNIPITGGSNF